MKGACALVSAGRGSVWQSRATYNLSSHPRQSAKIQAGLPPQIHSFPSRIPSRQLSYPHNSFHPPAAPSPCSFWKGTTSEEQLLAASHAVEAEAWLAQKDAGIERIAADGTLYDQVLDMTFLLGVAPARFKVSADGRGGPRSVAACVWCTRTTAVALLCGPAAVWLHHTTAAIQSAGKLLSARGGEAQPLLMGTLPA